MIDILDKLATEVDKLSENDSNNNAKTSKKDESEKKSSEKEENKALSPMDKLLSQSDAAFPEVGDTIHGTVIEVSSSEIYLDLAPFGTGVVMGKEIKDGMGGGKIKVGDQVTATIIEMENEDGFIELSIREASHEKAWEDIESKRDTQDRIATKILSANKGGLLVEINGITGFLPVSQLSSKNYPRVDDGDKNKILTLLKKLVGKELEVRIIDADKETEKLIVSEKAAASEKEKEVISQLNVGNVIKGEISGVVDFGAFIKFSPIGDLESTPEENQLEGLVHISELAWQLIEDPRTIVKVGDKIEAKIIGIDADKISLSIRALQKDPWSEVGKKYSIGDTVSGTVHKINHFGAFVYLDKDIHGLAHISEMSEMYPGKNIDELVKLGETYDWKILSIEPKEHRMGLVLMKKSQKDAEKKQNDKEEEEKPASTREDATSTRGGKEKAAKKKTKKEQEK